MKRLARHVSLLALVSLIAKPAYAVIPPSTALSSTRSGLSLLGWFTYGSIVIVLCGLLAAAAALIVCLIMELFRH